MAVPSPVRRRSWAVAVIGVLAAGAAAIHAQQIFSGFYGTTPPKFATPATFKGAFNFCRLMFTSNRREKRGWDTDYPGAEINFSVRLAELTKTNVSHDAASGDADWVVVRIMDEALFHCPYVLVEDGGTIALTVQEILRLREYLQKGGFIFASDYWGALAKDQWDQQIGLVLPPAQYPIADIPMDHSMWHSQFQVKRVPQMPSIQSWRRSGGANSERGPNEVQTARGIADEHGRLMVVMLHNTDIPDGWEREGEDHDYFFRFSPDAYAVGIDVLLYAMTH